MKTTILKFSLVAFSFFCLLNVNAQSKVAKKDKQKLTVEEKFAKADTNNDGVIVLAEYETMLAKKKERKERKATRGEASTKRTKNVDPAKRFAKVDSDGNGQVTLTEFLARKAKKKNKKNKKNKKSENRDLK